MICRNRFPIGSMRTSPRRLARAGSMAMRRRPSRRSSAASASSSGRMAAEVVVERPRDQQALLRLRPAAERHAQHRQHLGKARAQQVGNAGRAEHGGARAAVEQVGLLDEAVDDVDPARFRARCRRAGTSARAPRVDAAAALSRAPSGSLRDHETAAGDVGDLGGGVARAGIGHDHLAEQADGRARHQRRQRRHQRALRFVGGDDRR